MNSQVLPVFSFGMNNHFLRIIALSAIFSAAPAFGMEMACKYRQSMPKMRCHEKKYPKFFSMIKEINKEVEKFNNDQLIRLSLLRAGRMFSEINLRATQELCKKVSNGTYTEKEIQDLLKHTEQLANLVDGIDKFDNDLYMRKKKP